VVLNVESSHCYGNVAQFVAEVARVLKPGGVFAMADFRSPEQMSALEALLRAQAGLELVEAEDITSNVLDALDVRSAASPARLSALSPSPRPHARFLCSWTTSASASRSLRRLRQSSAGSLASSRGSRAAGSTPGVARAPGAKLGGVDAAHGPLQLRFGGRCAPRASRACPPRALVHRNAAALFGYRSAMSTSLGVQCHGRLTTGTGLRALDVQFPGPWPFAHALS
jgi:hypothetical protein